MPPDYRCECVRCDYVGENLPREALCPVCAREGEAVPLVRLVELDPSEVAAWERNDD